MTPDKRMPRAITHAKTGRSIKNRGAMIVRKLRSASAGGAAGWGLLGSLVLTGVFDVRSRDLHRSAGLHLLQAIHDDAIARLQTIGDEPGSLPQRADFDVAQFRNVVFTDHQDARPLWRQLHRTLR